MSTDDNSLHISWHDSAWIPHLNQANIMDYFSNRSNPFYDRTCNNEIIKMQRLSTEQLKSMTGLEYILLHVQEPILYVVRKQHRHSLEESTPLADYYIVAGRVYQAPDICAVINARMTTAVHNIRSAFEESLSYSRYHPSKGYWWEFKEKDSETEKKKRKKPKEELSSAFQRKRVDILLGDLSRKFPFKVIQPKPGDRPVPVEGMSSESASARPVIKEEIKEENNQSQNNANITSIGSSSVPNIAASVTSHSNTVTGQAAAAAAAGAAAAAAAAAGLSSSTNTTSSASGTFFTNTGPSNMKPSQAKKRKIMGK